MQLVLLSALGILFYRVADLLEELRDHSGLEAREEELFVLIHFLPRAGLRWETILGERLAVVILNQRLHFREVTAQHDLNAMNVVLLASGRWLDAPGCHGVLRQLALLDLEDLAQRDDKHWLVREAVEGKVILVHEQGV